MEPLVLVLLYLNLFLFACAGLLFTAAINHYKNATRHSLEARDLRVRLRLKNKRV